MKKKLILLLLLIMTPLIMGSARYNYSYYNEVVYSVPGMNYRTYFNGVTLDVSMSSPEDLVIYEQNIYIISSSLDPLRLTDGFTTKNGNVIVVDEQFNIVENHISFPFSDTYTGSLNSAIPLKLLSPTGIEVSDTGIYIADTGNKRVIHLNHSFEVLGVYDTIDDPTFKQPGVPDEEQEDKIDFIPSKITVDSSGRMYVVARNAFEGILELETNGSFNRFTGVNPIQLSPAEVVKRWFMTEEQLDKLPRYLPTEYTNIVMDDRNFMYATASAASNTASANVASANQQMIQLINPKGIDVLTRSRSYFPPQGDVQYVNTTNNYVVEGPSQFVDVAITDNGMYSVLDSKRARIFTYDSEGNLLYINGDEGIQSDKLSINVVALDYLNEDLLVLDKQAREVIVYELSAFGRAVNQAVIYYEAGDFIAAKESWEEVIKLNTNYEVAYNGIGKYYLRTGEYKKAVEYFKLGHDNYYYSKAYKAYRNEIIKANFGLIVISVLTVAVGLITYSAVMKKKKGVQPNEDS